MKQLSQLQTKISVIAGITSVLAGSVAFLMFDALRFGGAHPLLAAVAGLINGAMVWLPWALWIRLSYAVEERLIRDRERHRQFNRKVQPRFQAQQRQGEENAQETIKEIQVAAAQRR